MADILNDAWRRYAETRIAGDASLLTRIEARRAFYTGAGVVMVEVIKLLSSPDAPGKDAEALLNGISQEVHKFSIEVKEGRA